MPWQNYSIFGLTVRSDFSFISRLEKGYEKHDLTFTLNKKPPKYVNWNKKSPDYSSIFKNETGKSHSYMYILEDFEVLRFTEKADFYIFKDKVVCNLLSHEFYPLVEIQLLGTMLSYWLERQGIPAIHASVVNVNGNGVGFLSSNKGGKTSIAASLMQRGHSLVTDDIMAINHGDQIYCRPGYPTMRMWPEVAEHFLGHFEDLPLVHPELSKRRVFVGSDSFGSFYNKKVPLKCLYIPERVENLKSNEIKIESLSQSEALIELVKHSFIANLVDSIGLQPKRLEIFANIVRKIPVRRIIYPNGFNNLEKVCNVIINDYKK